MSSRFNRSIPQPYNCQFEPGKPVQPEYLCSTAVEECACVESRPTPCGNDTSENTQSFPLILLIILLCIICK